MTKKKVVMSKSMKKRITVMKKGKKKSNSTVKPEVQNAADAAIEARIHDTKAQDNKMKKKRKMDMSHLSGHNEPRQNRNSLSRLHMKKKRKMTPAQDAAYDRKHGIKAGSKADQAMDRKNGVAYKKKHKNWIQGAIKHPGALHSELGVPQGKKIPPSKLAAAARKGGVIGRRARLAQTLKGFHKGSSKMSANQTAYLKRVGGKK